MSCRRHRHIARRRPGVVWSALGALALVVGMLAAAACGGSAPAGVANPTASEVLSSGPTPRPSATAAVALPLIEPNPARLERAAVVHVVDGDTIDVELNGSRERVRYYGIDTPERGQPCFGEATARNSALIGTTVLLLPDARERDPYGRLLRYVFDSAGRSVDERLIAEGFAHAWRRDGAYRDELIALEDHVHTLAVGCLWGP